MHSLECFIAIINCNLYIKIRKTVRPIHLWAIINMVMTSLTTSHKLPNTSRALKQFHDYLLNLFSINTCVFLGCAHSQGLESAAMPSWMQRSPALCKLLTWLCPSWLLHPSCPQLHLSSSIFLMTLMQNYKKKKKIWLWIILLFNSQNTPLTEFGRNAAIGETFKITTTALCEVPVFEGEAFFNYLC